MRLAACLLLAGCTGAAPGVSGPTSDAIHGDRRYLIVESPYHCGTRDLDPTLNAAISNQREALHAALNVPLRPVTSLGELREALAVADRRPLLVFFFGHGNNEAPRGNTSELCFRDGSEKVENLLATVSPAVGHAGFVIDACLSSDIDIRPARVPTAVISASPFRIDATSLHTGLARHLPGALACADVNSDGWVDDRELLEALRAEIGQLIDAAQPIPRLRRQAWSPVPLLPAGPGTACARSRVSPGERPEMDASATGLVAGRERLFPAAPELFAEPRVFWGRDPGDPSSMAPGRAELLLLEAPLPALAAWARGLAVNEGFALVQRGSLVSLRSLRDNQDLITFSPTAIGEVTRRVQAGHWATASESTLWHGGKVGAVVETLDGRRFVKEALVATYCSHSGFGQCFAVRSRSSVPGGMRP